MLNFIYLFLRVLSLSLFDDKSEMSNDQNYLSGKNGGAVHDHSFFFFFFFFPLFFSSSSFSFFNFLKQILGRANARLPERVRRPCKLSSEKTIVSSRHYSKRCEPFSVCSTFCVKSTIHDKSKS